MKEEINKRLAQLRAEMKKKELSAFLINGCDPHLGEYVPDRYKTREYISGFSGSYGWLAITLNEAALWTDSRYYLQAQEQLEGTGIDMLKARLPETISVGDWLAQRLNTCDTVGFDGTCYSTAEVALIEKPLQQKEILVNHQIDLLEAIWADRPAVPKKKAFLHPLEWAGISRKKKLEIISSEIGKTGADMTIITALDDLCWTFNIRGADVDFNPVIMGFALVGNGVAKLFVQPEKFSPADQQELQSDGIELLDYTTFYTHLESLSDLSIAIDPDRTNSTIQKILEKKNRLTNMLSLPALLKSRKNEWEIEGMKKANIIDGLALLNFQLWLEKAIETATITEYDVAEKLTTFRSTMPGYRGDSFFPIVGYKDHGAIVHFHVSPESANTLQKEGVLLVDSGGQYEFGTTDTTRTFMLGEVTDQFKTDFTLVLKGMIGLSSISFPLGTIGCHLDVLARRAMWMNHINYGHGTGHGVGSYLNVHEGPVSIRLDLNNQPVCMGNVFSNEPAFYREGLYGLRTENVMYCTEDVANEFGEFLRFETLTMYPIDTRLIEKKLLEQWEIDWINTYHQTVFEKLSPLANADQLQLLKRLTQPF
jgi:Xaa-Pro aminopeptidase